MKRTVSKTSIGLKYTTAWPLKSFFSFRTENNANLSVIDKLKVGVSDDIGEIMQLVHYLNEGEIR